MVEMNGQELSFLASQHSGGQLRIGVEPSLLGLEPFGGSFEKLQNAGDMVRINMRDHEKLELALLRVSDSCDPLGEGLRGADGAAVDENPAGRFRRTVFDQETISIQ